MPVSLVGCQIHKLFMLWWRLSWRGERWWGVSTECLSKAVLSLFFLTVYDPFCEKRLRHRSDKGGGITFTKQVELLCLLLLNHCFSFVTTQTSNSRLLWCIFQLFGGEGKHSGQSACLSSDELNSNTFLRVLCVIKYSSLATSLSIFSFLQILI